MHFGPAADLGLSVQATTDVAANFIKIDAACSLPGAPTGDHRCRSELFVPLLFQIVATWVLKVALARRHRCRIELLQKAASHDATHEGIGSTAGHTELVITDDPKSRDQPASPIAQHRRKHPSSPTIVGQARAHDKDHDHQVVAYLTSITSSHLKANSGHE